jgi:integrase
MGKRKQGGNVLIQAGSWCVRWREDVIEAGSVATRKQRFKILRRVIDGEERRDRKCKLRIPEDIQIEVGRLLASVNADAPIDSQAAIARSIRYLVEAQYFPNREQAVAAGTFKPSSLKGYRDIWKLHLVNRIGGMVLHEFERQHAFLVWEQIHAANVKLTKRTMQHIRTFVSAVFRWAMDRGLYDGQNNPAQASLPEGLSDGKETGFYTLAEVARMLEVFTSPLAQAILALAYGAGLRKGELAAVRWIDYETGDAGAVIHVRQSSWNGTILKPKTQGSEDTVVLDAAFADFVAAYWNYCGQPTEGLMFPGEAGRTINLDSFARWQIKPLLHRCGVCKKHKGIHAKEDHEFERDTALPPWKGWHAFRRGNATLLASEKDREAAALMLRHRSSAVTDRHYVKVSKQERRVMDEKDKQGIEQRKGEAAQALGDAFRRAVN